MLLDIIALVVIAILIILVIWLLVLFGNMPGKIAKKRNHSQADAILVLGWIGIITMGIGWVIAIVWAYYKQGGSDIGESDLRKRVQDLENQLKQLQAGRDES